MDHSLAASSQQPSSVARAGPAVEEEQLPLAEAVPLVHCANNGDDGGGQLLWLHLPGQPPPSASVAAAEAVALPVAEPKEFRCGTTTSSGDVVVINTDLVASTVLETPLITDAGPPSNNNDNNNNNSSGIGILAVAASSSSTTTTADDPSSTIDPLDVMRMSTRTTTSSEGPAPASAVPVIVQPAYGLSDAHYEDPWSKKYRRRRRRRTRMMVGGMTGFVVGTFVLGPVGGLAGAATGAVVSRTASKIGERRKDGRLRRERRQQQEEIQRQQQQQQQQETTNAEGNYDNAEAGGHGQDHQISHEGTPLLEISSASSDEQLYIMTGGGSRSDIVIPSSPTSTDLSTRSSSHNDSDGVGQGQQRERANTASSYQSSGGGGFGGDMTPVRARQQQRRQDSFGYDEYDDLRGPVPQNSTPHGYESPREERRRRRAEGRLERRSERTNRRQVRESGGGVLRRSLRWGNRSGAASVATAGTSTVSPSTAAN